MTKLLSLALLSAMLALTGCKSNPGNARLIAQTTTYMATYILMEERPDTRPYMLTAAAAICTAAAGTNTNPALLMDTLQDLPYHNPYAAMFVNTTLSLWQSYYTAQDPQAQAVLLGTCDGLNLGLMSGARAPQRFPHIRIAQ